MKTLSLGRRGFTLIEILVVVTIIGILATIGIATYENQAEKARVAKEDAEAYQLCLETLAACVAAQGDDCVQCGGSELEDTGPGVTYAAIGDNVWFTQNYVTGTQVTTSTLQPGEKWCYNNNAANCDSQGGMYSRDMADQICSDGWRIPTYGEAGQLINDLGGNTQAVRDSILDGTNPFLGNWTGKKRHWGAFQGGGELHFFTTGGIYYIRRGGIGQSALSDSTREGAGVRCIQDI